MDFCKEATCWKSAVPGEGISHTTACSHDAYSREEQADEREPMPVRQVDVRRSVVACETHMSRQIEPALLPVAL